MQDHDTQMISSISSIFTYSCIQYIRSHKFTKINHTKFSPNCAKAIITKRLSEKFC